MRLLPLAAALLTAACTTGAPPSAEPSPKLTEALSGRQAGKPVSCINLRDISSTRIIDNSTIIYETSQRRWYVNRPPGGCPSLGPNRTLVTRTTTTSLCSGDIVRIVDAPSAMEFGSCGLGEFVPYTK